MFPICLVFIAIFFKQLFCFSYCKGSIRPGCHLSAKTAFLMTSWLHHHYIEKSIF